MTNFERRDIFVTKILPALPFAILVNKKRFSVEITKGRIAYKRGNYTYVEKSGVDHYEAGNKMLEWLGSHDVQYAPMYG